MARIYTEDDFEPQASRVFQESDFEDSPRKAEDYGEALLTNLPARGFGQNVVRGLPATAGSIPGAAAGALMGAPFGPLGMAAGGIIGAGLGGMAGESVRQATAQGTAAAFPEANYPVSEPRQILKDVGIAGISQAAGQGLGSGLAAAASALRPAANRIGAQIIRVASGVPEKTGEASLANPSLLLNAPGKEAASAGYAAFEGYTGLKGLGALVKDAGKFPQESALEDMLFGAAREVAKGTANPQDLYLASQAASNLKQMGKLGNPRYITLKSAINDAKNTVDDALEAVYPEYRSLRSDYFASKMADEFSNVLPLNKNLSPNVLRPTMAAGAAAAGMIAGNPASLLGLPLISPIVYGTAIKGAALLGKIPAGTYQATGQAGAGAIGAIAQEYARRR